MTLSIEQAVRVLESHPHIKHMVLLALYAEYVEKQVEKGLGCPECSSNNHRHFSMFNKDEKDYTSGFECVECDYRGPESDFETIQKFGDWATIEMNKGA